MPETFALSESAAAADMAVSDVFTLTPAVPAYLAARRPD